MADLVNHSFTLPVEQRAIQDKCFRPSETFVEFPIEEVERSSPARLIDRVSERQDCYE